MLVTVGVLPILFSFSVSASLEYESSHQRLNYSVSSVPLFSCSSFEVIQSIFFCSMQYHVTDFKCNYWYNVKCCSFNRCYSYWIWTRFQWTPYSFSLETPFESLLFIVLLATLPSKGLLKGEVFCYSRNGFSERLFFHQTLSLSTHCLTLLLTLINICFPSGAY